MNAFLTDVWYDLREKNLWPLALGLLLAIVVVLIALPDDAEETAVTTPTPAPAQAPDLRALVSLDQPTSGSRLDVFEPKNPFRPLSDVVSEGGGGTGTTTTTTTTTAPGGETTTGDTGTGATPGGGTGDTGTGDTGSGDTQTREPEQRLFTYTVDVRFGEEGERARSIRNVNRLDLLPSERRPFLVFLGVTPSGSTAVFLVDENIEVGGEGICRPTRGECTFLHLRLDRERDTATLTETPEDGIPVTYEIRLTDIDRIEVNEAGEPVGDGDRSTEGDRSPAFAGKKEKGRRKGASRRFSPPAFVDQLDELR